MRKVWISLLGIIATKIVVSGVKRLSRSRAMKHKVHDLQEKFRGLDTLAQSTD